MAKLMLEQVRALPKITDPETNAIMVARKDWSDLRETAIEALERVEELERETMRLQNELNILEAEYLNQQRELAVAERKRDEAREKVRELEREKEIALDQTLERIERMAKRGRG